MAIHEPISIIIEDQPHINEAINRLESRQWKKAIEAEFIQIEKLYSWDIVEAPPDTNITDFYFILHQKCDAQGNVS